METLADTVAGVLGNISSIIVGQPFDTVKVRVQAEAGRYSGPLDCAVKTVRHEGVRALFKGVVPPMVGNAPMGALLFVGYGSTTRYLEGRYGEVPEGTVDYTRIAAAAMVGGFLQVLAATPVELVKCKLQVQHDGRPKYAGGWDCVRKMVAAKGLRRGLFDGFGVLVLRDVPAFAVYFAVYAGLKHHLTPAGSDTPFTSLLFAGGMAGVLSWASIIPLDVVKSRIQTLPDSLPPAEFGILRNARALYAEGGAAAFWRGLVPTCLRAFPSNAALFVVYEATMSALA